MTKGAAKSWYINLKIGNLTVELFDLCFETSDFLRLLRVRARQGLVLLLPLSDLLLELLLMAFFALTVSTLRRSVLLSPSLRIVSCYLTFVAGRVCDSPRACRELSSSLVQGHWWQMIRAVQALTGRKCPNPMRTCCRKKCRGWHKSLLLVVKAVVCYQHEDLLEGGLEASLHHCSG